MCHAVYLYIQVFMTKHIAKSLALQQGWPFTRYYYGKREYIGSTKCIFAQLPQNVLAIVPIFYEYKFRVACIL
jgi:hypothetical protein